MAKSAPDGDTRLANSLAHASSPASCARLPYDTLRDLVNLASLASQPDVLIVGLHPGWKTAGDLVVAARAGSGTSTGLDRC